MNAKMSTIIFLLLTLLLSCQEKLTEFDSSGITANDSLNSEKSTDVHTERNQDENNPIEADLVYPKSGYKASDFLPTLGSYRIQYETIGDLNNDGKEDIAVVFAHKSLKTAPRPMLILLQNEDKSYRLDRVSEVAFPIEYNDFDFKYFDTEDLVIENGGLTINLYGMGPSGTIFTNFKYVENDFILTYIEAYYRGAGGSSGLVYDFTKEELTVNETNTMEEDMPTVSTTSKLKGKRYFFESTSITEFFNED